VREHDPALVLCPPNGVLPMYRRLAEGAVRTLRPGGWLAVELGYGLAEPVEAACRAAGLTPSPPRLDLAGIPRVLAARRT
jgi:release factor glutamine methyltransferase